MYKKTYIKVVVFFKIEMSSVFSFIVISYNIVDVTNTVGIL